MNEKPKPTFSSRVGNVSVATWTNEHEGRKFYNTTVDVSYKDKNGEHQNGKSFSTSELLCLIACAKRVLAKQLDALGYDE